MLFSLITGMLNVKIQTQAVTDNRTLSTEYFRQWTSRHRLSLTIELCLLNTLDSGHVSNFSLNYSYKTTIKKKKIS